MFKPNKLLKVVSIIFIVLAVMGAIGTVGSYFMLQSMGDVVNGVDMSAVKAMATPLTLLQGLFSSLLMLVCGIFGLNGKSFKGMSDRHDHLPCDRCDCIYPVHNVGRISGIFHYRFHFADFISVGIVSV